ncbi:DEHA2F10230p [Debaryomyces hansenii CBS767]|uniref:AP complex subunit sigma n=1 Tax=Debaryomyces hansenii (strain ATCC 36239 / CBS 767 / BCRC 21394 / JCM 1990 / NBRC 0083 / IGC 2968) TaxID=284592 RepID=Q6BLW2_DEBHA|nr:DEHA2F10230p [Debaryomyces hansenii CBS767]CAG89150.2 DEHA2F10230p [Debaryomyces hansenii CBS767]|eukprot:XP_460809.2 DEHA2F10230p [Debaryomyces hansenii CBS767]
MAIHFILVLNRQGKTRLAKWFDNNYTTQDKQRYTTEIHRLISSRDSKYQSNFIEYQQNKLVYRRYAGLYFISSIDLIDSELDSLESLHFLVEVLDVYFDNVCELDLIFNFYKLYSILDEIFLGGEFQEISKDKILERLAYLDKLD